MCRRFYQKGKVVFSEGEQKEITISFLGGGGNERSTVTHIAPTWEDLHSYLRKLTNPDSRI